MAADGSLVFDTKVNAEGFKGAMASLESAGNKAFKGIAAGAAAIGSALGTAGAAAVKVGTEFETAMAKTSTMFGSVNVDTQNLNAQVLELSGSTGLAASAIGESLYNALSAGIPATQDMGDAMLYMEKNSKLAKAGFTDIDTAVTATAKVLNAYGMDVSETDRVHKVLMQTQNKGITTVGELGASLAQVTPIAAAMNVSFEQVGASLANMTAAGTPTAEAITQLKSLFSELGKQGADAQQALMAAAEGSEYAGMSFQDMMEAGVPLNEVLGLMRDYAEEGGLSLVDLFGSIEAGNAALSLSGQNAQKFSDNLAAMSAEADVVGDAYEKVTDTLEAQSQTALESLKNIGISFYRDVETPMKKSVASITRTLNSASFKTSCDKISQSFGEMAEGAGRLAEKVLPDAAEAFAFLAENLGAIVRVAGSAYAAFKSFEIVKSVGTWLSAARKAIDIAKKSLAEMTLASGAAAVQQAALKGELTLTQLAAGLYAHQIDLVTAKTAILNAVTSANPYVLLAAAVAAVAVGFGVYVATAQKASDATKELVNDTEDLISEGRNLMDSLKENAEQREAEAESIEAEAAAAKVLSDQLYALAGKAEKTAAEKAQMAIIVDRLNEKIPELGLAIDEETGALNKNQESVNDVVNANLELVKAAAASKRAMAAAADLTQAEMNLEKYNDQLDELLEAFSKATGAPTEDFKKSIYDLAEAGGMTTEAFTEADSVLNQFWSTAQGNADAKALYDEIAALVDPIAENKQAVGEFTDEVERCSEYAGKHQAAAEAQSAALDKSAKSADKAGDSLEGLADSTASLSDRFGAAMESVGKDAEDAGKIIEDTMDTAKEAATNAFSEIEQNTALSVDQMIANLKANQEATAQWGENLKILAERGVNAGLIATLREAGPEMALQTQALVNASDEELARLSEVWVNGISTGVQAGNNTLEAEMTAMQSTMETGMDGVAESAAAGGAEIPRRFGDGIRTGILQVEEAGAEMGSSTTAAVESVPDQMSAKGQEAGAAYSQGVEDGASQTTPDIGAPAIQSAEDASNEIQVPAQDTAQALPDALQNAVPETEAAANANKDAFIGPMRQAGTEIQTALEPASAAVTTFSGTAKTQMEAMAQAVEDQTGAASDTLKKWFSDIQKQTDKETAEFVSKTEKQLKKMPPKFETVGKESVKGIWKGMQAEQGWLNRQIASLIDSAIKAAKEAADIHSPSGRTAREVGEPLAEGVAKGVEDKMPEVSERMNAWVKSLIDEFGEEALKNIGVTADAIAEQFGGIYDTVKDHATNAFSTIKEADELSVQDLIHNLEDNQRAIEDWADNLQRAADRGLDEGLLQKFREAGPEMNNTLENIVNASDREFERFNEQCAASGETINYTFGTIFDSMEPGIREAIAKAIAEYEKMPGEAEQAASGTGSGVARGVSSGSGEVSAAAKGTVDSASAEYGKLPAAASQAASGANTAVASALRAGSADVTGAVGEIVAAAGAEYGKLAELAADAGKSAATGFSEAVKAQFDASPPDFKTPMETAGKAALDGAGTVFAQLPLRIAPHLEATRVRIAEWLSTIGLLIVERTRSFHDALSDALNRMNETASEHMRIALENARQWFQDQIAEANARMPEFTGAILSPLEQLPGEYEDVGRRMAEGLWDGMDSMRGWIEGQIQDFVDGLVEAAQAAADIHSPSRRMAKAVGAPMAAGVGQGFEGEAPRVAGKMQADLGGVMRRMEAAVQAEAARYGQKAAVMQTNNSITDNREVSGDAFNITVNWTGGGDDVDVNRLARLLGKKVRQQVRARGGGIL